MQSELFTGIAINGKVLKLVGKEEIGKGVFYYKALFAPERKLWWNLSKDNNLIYQVTEHDGKIKEVPDIKPGIFVSTKGMPTGIIVDPKRGGAMGNYPLMYILVEYDKLKFDIGRKSIQARHKDVIQDIAKRTFSKLNNWFDFIKGESPQTNSSIAFMEKMQLINDLETRIPNLGIEGINFSKQPDGQEAAVSAIFHELIGAKILLGYYGLSTGYRDKYDIKGWYKIDKGKIGQNWRGKIKDDTIKCPIIIELKHEASDILEDIEEKKKQFMELDLIVCWDIDEQEFSTAGVKVNPLSKEDALYFGSNYELEFPQSFQLGERHTKPVIALRRLIESIRTS